MNFQQQQCWNCKNWYYPGTLHQCAIPGTYQQSYTIPKNYFDIICEQLATIIKLIEKNGR